MVPTFMGFGNAQVWACTPRYPTYTNRLRYFRVETSTARLRRDRYRYLTTLARMEIRGDNFFP